MSNDIVLEDVRCHRCGRLLYRATPGALKPGAVIEDRCHSCKATNTLVGEETTSK